MVTGDVVAQNPSNEDHVDIGDGRIVSMQTVQQIYHQITGQKEELANLYRANHKVEMADLSHLNTKIEQICEQYNVVSSNCAVTVYFTNDQKQTFSTYGRFSAFDQSTPSSVERIGLQYNFLVILPNLATAQSYEIEIDVTSRAAAMERSKQFEEESAMFFGYFLRNTGSLSISYVDYLVARSFKQAVDDWFATLPIIRSSMLLARIRRSSRDFNFVFRLASALIFLFACYTAFYLRIATGDLTPHELFKVSIVTFGGLYFINIVSSRFATMATEAARMTQPISYINLTRGDGQALTKLEGLNKKSVLKIAAAVVGTIALNITSAWIALVLGVGAS